MKRRMLAKEFFARPTLQVARGLLGKYLVRDSGSGLLAGRIIEVEAYVGPEDRASHASRGRTPRNDVMFGAPGLAYVYLIYGMYHCLNVVTEREGFPSAILIRAVEVESASSPTLVDGPGRLCRAFGVDRSFNQLDLTAGRFLWFEDRGARIQPRRIAALSRIGVGYAGVWAAKPWRFRITSSPA